MKPKSKRIVSRRIKFLALAAGLVNFVLLAALIRVVVPVQLETTVVPDPMAYFQAHRPAVRDAHADIKERHAAVWVVRRSAFLPILDVSKVPPDLRNTAKAYNNEMSDRLESATAALLVSQPLRSTEPMHPFSAASHEYANWFPKQADYEEGITCPVPLRIS